MADIDYDKLSDAVARAMKRGSSSSGGFTSQASKPVDFSLNPLKNTAAGVADAFTELTEAAKGGLDTWRTLSRNGASFSNDLIGMTSAAFNSRMSLEDFSDIIVKNGKQFAGLGGNVSAGSEAFAKFSQGFFDNRFDDQLRNLGLTTKEMNEVMAIHIGNVRTSAAQDEEGRKKEYAAAAALATEMDATSKLMGKSREIQMEEMKARQVDMQVQAKIRAETAKMRAEGKSEEEISAYKKNVAAALQKAANEGVGQAAKEIYATGTVTSQTGGTQAALSGGQIGAVTEELGAIRRGDTKAAAEASAKATAEAIRLQNDSTIQSIQVLGAAAGADIEASLKEGFGATQTLFDSIESTAKKYSFDLKTQEGRLAAVAKAREEALAKPPPSKTGATEGALAIEKTGQEIRAGAAKAANAIAEGGESIADQLRKTGATIAQTLRDIQGPGRSLGGMIGEKAQKGLKPEQVTQRPGEGSAAFENRKAEASGGVLGDAAVVALNASKTVLDGVNSGIKEVGDLLKDSKSTPRPVTVVDIKPKASGGPVGLNGPEIILAGEAGPEYVLNDKLAKDFVKSAISSLPSPKLDAKSFAESMQSNTKGGAGYDLNSISKEISVNISSVQGGGSTTTRRVQSAESKESESMRDFLEEELRNYKKETFAKQKEALGPDATYSQIKNSLKDNKEFTETIKLAEEELQRLERRIAEGTTFEVEKKEEALEKSKLLIEEQSNVISTSMVGITKTMSDELDKTAEVVSKNAEVTSESAKNNPVKGLVGDDGTINLDAFSISDIGKNLRVGGVGSIAKDIKSQDATKNAEKPGESVQAQSAAQSQSKPTTQTPPSEPGKKASTLDDVVGSLNRLNTQMSQLITQQSELLGKQIRTTKSAGSSNLYDRVTP